MNKPIIKNYFLIPGINNLSIEHELDKIINYFKINKEDIRNIEKDNNHLRNIRKKICFFLYNKNYSYNAIKEVMYRKTHANILYHNKTVKGRMEVDRKYKQEIINDYFNIYNTSLSTIL